jgi:hypothetical protein
VTAIPLAACIVICALLLAAPLASGQADAPDLWDLAQENGDVHRFSTLFMAQDVRDHLGTDRGIDQAIDWCRKTGVTRVYVETFRDGYQADRAVLEKARNRLTAAGLDVLGCITPTVVGKPSTGWKDVISCYTDLPAQQRVEEIFTFAAGLFDQIMIDDFWFTDCACPQCDQARAARTVTIGSEQFPVAGDSWAAFRCELMLQLSRSHVLAAAKRVNPRCRLIIKYPQWYDNFHNRGYDVARETADFDRIWVGTETRDYGDSQWGGTPQYEAYFIMRWLGGIGGEKCGGGWYDPLGTSPHTYIEQARQTILGGARESMLFAYGPLQQDTGPANVEALRKQLPELLRVAREVHGRPIRGIAAYKPPGSDPGNDQRIFDFVGMLGLPLVPCHEFPTDAPAAFFSTHAMSDPGFVAALGKFIDAGKPVLLSSELRKHLPASVDITKPNVHTLQTSGSPKSLLEMEARDVTELRSAMLQPLGVSFDAPVAVALYLFDDGSWVIESFRDDPSSVLLNGHRHTVSSRGWVWDWAQRP